MQSKQLGAGFYDVTVNGRLFEIERTGAGEWMLVEITDNGRDYWNHFATKRAAMEAIKAEA